MCSDFVLSKVEVAPRGGWVNRFAGRVEQGMESIKYKKKKVKKKRTDPTNDAKEKSSNNENVLNERDIPIYYFQFFRM